MFQFESFSYLVNEQVQLSVSQNGTTHYSNEFNLQVTCENFDSIELIETGFEDILLDLDLTDEGYTTLFVKTDWIKPTTSNCYGYNIQILDSSWSTYQGSNIVVELTGDNYGKIKAKRNAYYDETIKFQVKLSELNSNLSLDSLLDYFLFSDFIRVYTIDCFKADIPEEPLSCLSSTS